MISLIRQFQHRVKFYASILFVGLGSGLLYCYFSLTKSHRSKSTSLLHARHYGAADSIMERFNSNKCPSDETQEPNYSLSSFLSTICPLSKRYWTIMTIDHCHVFLMRKKLDRFQVKIATYQFSIGESESIELCELGEKLRSCDDFDQSKYK